MELGLADARCFVVGGSGEIGAAVTIGLAGEGARVVIGYHRQAGQAERVRKDCLEAGAPAAGAVPVDLLDPASIPTAVERATQQLGGLDVLVLCAVSQVPGVRGSRLTDIAPHARDGFLAANVTGTVALAQASLPHLSTGGWGRVLLLSSLVAARGADGRALYGASKGFAEALVRSLAWEVGRDGVLVNCLALGFTATTALSEALGAGRIAVEAERTATGSVVTSASVASTAVWLASPANGHVTGQVIRVTAGL